MNNNELRIICTEGDGNRWIKGEIYEYKNNAIKDCRGYEWGNFYDFNEFEELIKSSFRDVYFEEFKFNIGDKAIKRENNEEVVIYGYIIDGANNLEYIISNNKSKDTLRQKMDRYPEAVIEEEYMDKTCSFIYPISLEKVNKPLEDKQEKNEEQIVENNDKMNKFNIGDKVISKDESFFGEYFGEEVGVVVGIDTREEVNEKYLVKFNSLEAYEGSGYGRLCNNPELIVKPYEGYAVWANEVDIELHEGSAIQVNDLVKDKEECEEDIKIKFDKIREQKKETIKEMSEKVLEMTLEIKEIEHEIERIKKEWHLD